MLDSERINAYVAQNLQSVCEKSLGFVLLLSSRALQQMWNPNQDLPSQTRLSKIANGKAKKCRAGAAECHGCQVLQRGQRAEHISLFATSSLVGVS
jgi:hypothetical protein